MTDHEQTPTRADFRRAAALYLHRRHHDVWFPRNRGGFPMPLPAWSWIP